MRIGKTLSCTIAVIAAIVLTASASQAATTWFVATTGSDTNAGTQASPFGTIQHAINTAAAGDTINVVAGTYRESLDWEKDLVIQRYGQGLSIIDPSAASGGPGGRCILAANLTSASHLDGFTLQHGHAAIDEPPGGGLFNASSNLLVSNCAFVDNSGSGAGNGSSSPEFVNCTFAGNNARGGGGMANGGSSPTLVNCTFCGNHAGFGGAIFNDASSPAVMNCTFAGNSAVIIGSGIYSQEGLYPQLSNCILWGDTGGEIVDDTAGGTTITTSDVQGCYAGTGNLNADPLFVRSPTIVLNADGTVNLSASDFGDLRLQAASPCIDTGNTSVVTAANGFLLDPTNTFFIDLAGTPRISGAAVDMGAYEFQNVLLQAEAQVQTLMNGVKALVDGGAILPASGQPLYAKLDAAIGYLQAGDKADAVSVLQAFINQVKAFVKTGRLTPTQGQALIAQAQAIITLLGG